jgi:hypothetical protein
MHRNGAIASLRWLSGQISENARVFGLIGSRPETFDPLYPDGRVIDTTTPACMHDTVCDSMGSAPLSSKRWPAVYNCH